MMDARQIGQSFKFANRSINNDIDANQRSRSNSIEMASKNNDNKSENSNAGKIMVYRQRKSIIQTALEDGNKKKKKRKQRNNLKAQTSAPLQKEESSEPDDNQDVGPDADDTGSNVHNITDYQ
jgi:hypothetical protein